MLQLRYKGSGAECVLCTSLQALMLSLPLQHYITEDERAPGIPEPEVPVLLEQFKDDPHKYIAQLNGGHLPYELASKLLSFKALRKPLPQPSSASRLSMLAHSLMW